LVGLNRFQVRFPDSAKAIVNEAVKSQLLNYSVLGGIVSAAAGKLTDLITQQ
jgi:hypothetical protein